nr:hypothetical protein TetV2_00179 [Oceanusvirus sp.]
MAVSARQQWAAHLADPRSNPYDGPDVELMMTSEANSLLKRAGDNAHFDLMVTRRKMVTSGSGDREYRAAVADVRSVLGAGVEIRSRLRQGATERRSHEASDLREIPAEIREAESSLAKSTNGSERERLIRGLVGLRRRQHDARFAAMAAKTRAVTDLDASGLRSSIKNLRSLAKRRATDRETEDDDEDEDHDAPDAGDAAVADYSEFDRSQMYHSNADPLRWYD